jgi:hypothetical protein
MAGDVVPRGDREDCTLAITFGKCLPVRSRRPGIYVLPPMSIRFYIS